MRLRTEGEWERKACLQKGREGVQRDVHIDSQVRSVEAGWGNVTVEPKQTAVMPREIRGIYMQLKGEIN